MAGQGGVHALLVTSVLVVYRAHHGELLGMLGDHRNMLAKLDAGGGGGDGLELSAEGCGRIRLGIEGLVVAHAAPGVYDDAGLRLARERCGRVRLRLEEGGQGQSGQPHTGTKEVATRMLQAQHKSIKNLPAE